MKIVVITLADDGYRQVEELTTPNKRAYCEKHGYDFKLFTSSLDPQRPIPWSKLQAIIQTLNDSDYDWAFWTDPDSLIMNSDVSLEEIIDPEAFLLMRPWGEEPYDLIFNEDDNGINTGHFFAKNSLVTLELFQLMWKQVQFTFHPWWEQAALHFVYPRFKRQIKLVSARVMNSHPFWGSSVYKDGDFIIHFSGMREPRNLLPMIRQYLGLCRCPLDAS